MLRITRSSAFALAVSIVSLLAPASASADTDVGGNITQDTIWGPNSPTIPDTVYIVISDVTIQNGATLTIEPGVVVRFNEGLSLSAANGTLTAHGGDAEGEEITFTSNQPEPLPGDWAAINGSTQGHISLTHCMIEYGGASTWGGCLTGYNSDIYIASSEVRHSSTHGIRWDYYGSDPEGVRIEDCDVEDNGGKGISLYFSDASSCSPVVSDCRIRRNTGIGLLCSYTKGSSGSPFIGGCEVTDSGAQGMRGYGGEGIYCNYATDSSGDPEVVDCFVGGNYNEGIECHYDQAGGDCTIRDCTFAGNEEDGLQCFYTSSSGTATVTGCYVEGNAESGIEINHYNGSTGESNVTDCLLIGGGSQGNSQVLMDYDTGSSGTMWISGCTLQGSMYMGLHLCYDVDSWGQVIISDCAVADSYGHGIFVWYDGPPEPSQVSIDSCFVSGAGWDSVRVDGTVGVTLSNTLGATSGNGANLSGTSAQIWCCTLVGNTYDGLRLTDSECTLDSSILAHNVRYGVRSTGSQLPYVSYCDFWENAGGAMSGEFPGEENLYLDPEFADYGGGDYRLTCGSPCVDAGDPNTPPVDGTRIDMGAFQFGGTTAAPDPEPYGGVALFGEPLGGFPAWVWFSIPFHPCGSAEPPDVLGFECSGAVYRWDKYGKYAQVYKPPFVTWDLEPGESYMLYMTETVPNPSYLGANPDKPFEFKLGRMGWTWLGMPGNVPSSGDDFMASVQIKYPSDEFGEMRTAQEDYDATPDNWIAWGWSFFDTGTQAAKTFTPYAPFGNTDCHPWLGYRAWVNVGAAPDEYDPDQATLIWP